MNIEKNKSLINLIAPIVCGVMVFMWARKNTKDEQKALIFGGVGFLLSWLITRQIVGRVIDAEQTPPEVIYKGNSVVDSNFDPRPYTNELTQDIYEIFGVRNVSIYDRVASLNDAELMEVYNDYSVHPANEDKETLIQAMNGEVYGFTMSGPPNILDRLTRLGAN